MGRLTGALLEAKRRSTPTPKVDPNDDPDMIAMGEQVAERLHRLIDQVVVP
jgi:hypothetical protein